MIKFIPLLEKSNIYNSNIVGTMSWLFLIYKYDNRGLELKSWMNDNRMGITLADALPYLLKYKYIKNENNFAKVSNFTYIKNILMEYFMVFPDYSLNYYQHFNFFKKYDTGKYTISEIPLELYEANLNSSSAYNQNNAGEVLKVKNWFLNTYQYDIHKWNPNFNKLLGKIGLLVDDKTYKVFRGINVASDMYSDIKIGDTINVKNMSWTLSYDIAKDFAFGHNDWGSRNSKLKSNRKGIILYGAFEPKELLMDVNYVRDNDDYFAGEIKFGEEYEIISSPKTKEVKVFKIFNNTELEESNEDTYIPTEKEKKQFGRVKAGYDKPSSNIKQKPTHCDIYIDGQIYRESLPIPLALSIKKQLLMSRPAGSVTIENKRIPK